MKKIKQIKIPKSTKKSTTPDYSKSNMKSIHCSKCGRDMKVAQDATGGICWRCVCKLVPAEPLPPKHIPSGNPRGWKKMKLFVDATGNAYIKGVLQPLLKDTLPATIIKEKQKGALTKKKTIALKHSTGAILTDLNKKLLIAKSDKTKAKIQLEINTHQKTLKSLA